MVTDPIGNMITSIKNAGNAGHENVSVPYSNFKYEIAQLLSREGFVGKVTKKGKKIKKTLDIDLIYKNSKHRIKEVKRLSKPSRRQYMGIAELKKSMKDKGVVIVSTPKGMMTAKDAVKALVGGEALFLIY